MPSSRQASTMLSSTASPRLCPSVRGSPRSCAHRPLPSMTRATCVGRNSSGTAGVVEKTVTPLLCHHRPQNPEPVLYAPCAIAHAPGSSGVHDVTRHRKNHRPRLSTPPARRPQPATGCAPTTTSPAAPPGAGWQIPVDGIPCTPLPPASGWKARCGPGLPHCAQLNRLGAQPAWSMGLQ